MVKARPLQRIIVRACAALLLAGPAAAETTALVQARAISLSDSFQVVITTDQDVSSAPDFSPLEQDFDILGQSKSSNISIVNGTMTRATNWVLELMAKREGTLTLPSLAIGQERTAPVEITVASGGRTQTGTTPADVDLEIDIDNLAPYVQQQFIFTVRLVHTAQFGDASLSEPTVTGGSVIVEKLGDDIAYESTRGQTRVGIIERRYALFAQGSGKIRIEPLRFEARVGSGRGLRFDPFARGRIVRKQSDAIEVDVQPIPADFDGATWLPAAELEIREQAPQAAADYRVGEPFTRTLTIEASGLAASQLPEIQPALPDSLKQYPDQPVLKNRADADGLIAVRQEKVAIIPSQPGQLALPEIEIPWWNTRTGRQEYARLPARTIEVLPGTGAGTDTTADDSVATGEPGSATLEAARADADSPAKGPAPPWAWISLALAAGWLVTAAGWYRSRRAAGVVTGKTKAHTPAKDLEEGVRVACAAGSANACKDALLDWGRAQWPGRNIHSLGELAALLDGPLQQQVHALGRHLYRETEADWDGQPFWQAFANREDRRPAANPPAPAQLEPLYR